MEDESI
ncbi:hypothetical protein CP082626L3_0476A, partial [Chlamydia psittaci 08-2626_L3]